MQVYTEVKPRHLGSSDAVVFSLSEPVVSPLDIRDMKFTRSGHSYDSETETLYVLAKDGGWEASEEAKFSYFISCGADSMDKTLRTYDVKNIVVYSSLVGKFEAKVVGYVRAPKDNFSQEMLKGRQILAHRRKDHLKILKEAKERELYIMRKSFATLKVHEHRLDKPTMNTWKTMQSQALMIAQKYKQQEYVQLLSSLNPTVHRAFR